MKNIKIEEQYVGHDFWPGISIVEVAGNPEAKPFPQGTTEENETVIQTWQKVAVLKVAPEVPFKVGYIHGDSFHYLKVPVETEDGMFGMRVGDDDAKFFVLSAALDQDLSLELVELANENDPKYQNLPLY